ncbi:MAG: hypothetical protein OEZ10_08645 [Gammaproteobacteria bacterium]|nr:hypothetical protein [Gammaproteobacteria bacterium]
MSAIRDSAINHVIEIEGGYVNNPNDSGGETCWGITRAVAIANGYTGAMQSLPRDLAFRIYVDKYWAALRLDEIEREAPLVAAELVDSAINAGTVRAGSWLQRSLNVLNNRGALYADIVADGKIGDKTLAAFVALLDARGQAGADVLFKMLNALQGAFYIELAERREKDETFVFGWFKWRVK